MHAVTDLAAIEKNTYDNHHFHVDQFKSIDDEDINKKEVSSIFIKISIINIIIIFHLDCLLRGRYYCIRQIAARK